MDFKQYQEEADKFDQQDSISSVDEHSLTVPLLGLASEAGALLAEHKKKLRDKDSHTYFVDHFEEELGDVLWYLSNVATRLGLSLDKIALVNLEKLHGMWPRSSQAQMPLALSLLYDDGYDEDEQIPREFQVHFKEKELGGKVNVKISIRGVNIGDKLSDNADLDDGYRFHDAFHLANAAVLGWSPVVRALLKKKRKSHPQIDEVQDGQRAIIIEEAIVAFTYDYARRHRYFEEVEDIDGRHIQIIKSMVEPLEVRSKKPREWRKAILDGYNVFRQLWNNGGGVIDVNLNKQTIKYLSIDN